MKNTLVLVIFLIVGTLLAQPQNLRELTARMNRANPANGHRLLLEIKQGGAPVVKALVGTLKQIDDAESVDAAFALEALVMDALRPDAKQERKQLAATLAETLRQPNMSQNAQRSVLRLLQLCGGSEQVPAIAPFLEQDATRVNAIFALTSINTEPARLALLDSAQKSEHAREYISAFAELHEQRATPLLLKLLEQSKGYERVNVIDALGECGTPDTTDILFEIMKSAPRMEKDHARAALIKMTESLTVNDRNREALAIAQKLYDNEPSLPVLAALLRCRQSSFKDYFPQLMKEASQEDAFARQNALQFLLALHNHKSMTAYNLEIPNTLVEMAKNAKPEIKVDILTMLGAWGEPTIQVVTLLETSMKDSHEIVRHAAMRAWTKLVYGGFESVLLPLLVSGEEADIPVLKEVLYSHRQYLDTKERYIHKAIQQAQGNRRVALLELLALFNKIPDASKTVLDTLKEDKDKAVRKAAWKALETLAATADIPAILAELSHVQDTEERHGIEAVLKKAASRDSTLIPLLISELKKSQGDTRISLQQVLGNLGGDAATACLRDDALRHDGALSLGAVRALTSAPRREYLETLFEIAAWDNAPDLHTLALRGLFQYAAAEGLSRDESLAHIKKSALLCRNLVDRRLMLGTISSAPSEEVLKDMVMPAFDIAELFEEASAAAVKIVCAARPLAGETAITAMKKVLAGSRNPALHSQADYYLGALPPEGANIAFNKPVTTSCGHEQDFRAEMAVDGIVQLNVNGWYGEKWPCSLTVDFGKTEEIDSVRPIFFWDGNRHYAYTIEISNDQKVWRQIVDASSNTTQATSKGINHLVLPAAHARYLRINIVKNSANRAAHLIELEVYSKTGRVSPAPGPNLLFRQPVTAGSKQEQDHVPERINDGLLGKFDGWHTDKCPTWVMVDMQKTREIDTIRAIFHWDGKRTYAYYVEVSEDSQNWRKVVDNTNNEAVSNALGFIHTFPAVKARYVRLTVTRGWANRYVHVVELEAYAPGTAPKEYPAAEKVSKRIPLPAPDADGFITLFNGKNLDGWEGNLECLEILPGGIMSWCKGKFGRVSTQWDFKDFEYHFDFLQTPGANNGVAFRTPIGGPTMELQIIDNDGYKAQGHELKSWQHHGSIYGIVPAKDGALRKAGEWNHEVIIARGSRVTVIVNNKVIVDADLDKITDPVDGKGLERHPELKNRMGRLGFLGHGDVVQFKNIRIKPY